MCTGVHTYKYTWYMQTCTHTQWGEGKEKEVEKKQKREEERMEKREEGGEEKEKTRSPFH